MKMSFLFRKLTIISLFFLLSFIAILPAYAAPKEIILIRHADKLNQPNPGPFLSPLGRLRAEKLSTYYLYNVDQNIFHEPNYIITTYGTHASNRELQTVMPLVTALDLRHPTIGQPILLDKEYSHGTDLPRLYKDLLKNPKFKDETILICWHHGEIPALLDGLGVTPHQHKLADEEYDTVYDIKFDRATGYPKLIILPNQYPAYDANGTNNL